MTEDEPIDFFIYADEDAFYDALGPGTRENVGGQANADIRTLFALIPPREIDDAWVAEVVPHELVHLVFDTAVENPYHFPPRWLNEGLAVYLQRGLRRERPRRRRGARPRDGTLIPLDGLTGQFPTTADGFFLAYAESVSAVDFLIRTHGQDALLELIDSYAEGRTDDEAFSAAIGVDVAAFDAAWLADLGAEAPTGSGPQPAPPGPLPAAWTGTAASPLAGATGGAGPDATRDGGPGPAAPQAATSGSARHRAPRGGRLFVAGRGWSCVVRAAPRWTGRRRDRARPGCGRSRPGSHARARAARPSGFLVAAQLASEGPRVRYTTQERSPLVETAQRAAGPAGRSSSRRSSTCATQIQATEAAGQGSAAWSASSTTSSRRRASRPASSR